MSVVKGMKCMNTPFSMFSPNPYTREKNLKSALLMHFMHFADLRPDAGAVFIDLDYDWLPERDDDLDIHMERDDRDSEEGDDQ